MNPNLIYTVFAIMALIILYLGFSANFHKKNALRYQAEAKENWEHILQITKQNIELEERLNGLAFQYFNKLKSEIPKEPNPFDAMLNIDGLLHWNNHVKDIEKARAKAFFKKPKYSTPQYKIKNPPAYIWKGHSS